MDDDAYLALTERLARLRVRHRKSKSDSYPPSVALLEDMIAKVDTSNDELIALRSLLTSEYRLHGMLEKEEGLLRQEIEIWPDEPMSWISLADFLLYTKEDFDEALNIVEAAIGKARQKGEWVRHAYCTRARIARRLKDYNLLEETIRFLIDHRPAPDCIDIQLEYDFLVALPPGKISDEILAKYNALKSPEAGPIPWPEASE